MTTPKFAMRDTKQANGFYINFSMDEIVDEHFDPSDYLFQDDDYKTEDQARLDAFNNGDWHGIGIRAIAHCHHIINGHEFRFTIESAGLWGNESDCSDDYKNEIYQEQIDDLKTVISAIANPIYS